MVQSAKRCLQVAAALLAMVEKPRLKKRKVILIDKNKIQSDGSKERLIACVNGTEDPDSECQTLRKDDFENFKARCFCGICF